MPNRLRESSLPTGEDFTRSAPKSSVSARYGVCARSRPLTDDDPIDRQIAAGRGDDEGTCILRRHMVVALEACRRAAREQGSKAHTGFEPVLPENAGGKPDSGSRRQIAPVSELNPHVRAVLERLKERDRERRR